jgi:hypothetical protein
MLFLCTVPKLLIRKKYYVLFPIPVFIVQMTKLVHFTEYNTFSEIPPSTSMHFTTRVRTAYRHIGIFGICEDVRHFYNTPTVSLSRVTTANRRFTPIHMQEERTLFDAKSRLLYSEIALSRKPFGIGHMYICTFSLEWPILWPIRILTFPPWTLGIRQFESHVQITNWCAPWKLINHAGNLFFSAGAAISVVKCLSQLLGRRKCKPYWN